MTTLLYYAVVYVWICLFSTQFYQVSCTECYVCGSLESWEACHNGLGRTNCSGVHTDYDTCVKQYIIQPGPNNTRIIKYIKRCGARDECDQIRKACKERGYYCEADCCSTDLCNSSATLLSGVSGITYVIYVLSWFVMILYHG